MQVWCHTMLSRPRETPSARTLTTTTHSTTAGYTSATQTNKDNQHTPLQEFTIRNRASKTLVAFQRSLVAIQFGTQNGNDSDFRGSILESSKITGLTSFSPRRINWQNCQEVGRDIYRERIDYYRSGCGTQPETLRPGTN